MAAKNISNRNEAITFMVSNDALENDLSVDIFYTILEKFVLVYV